jgi:hypothetical protein
MPEITDEEYQRLEAYKAFGSPDEINTVLTERSEMVRANALTFAAETLGFKPNVLSKLAKGLEIKVEDNKAFIVDGEEKHDLADYAKENWEDFMPSLTATTETKPSGVSYVSQSAVNREAKKSGKKATVNYVLQRYGWVLGNDSVK